MIFAGEKKMSSERRKNFRLLNQCASSDSNTSLWEGRLIKVTGCLSLGLLYTTDRGSKAFQT